MKNRYFIFKPSKSHYGIWNLTKTLFQTTIFWVIFLYLIPKIIVEIEIVIQITGFVPAEQTGWVLFVFFSFLGIYSGFTMSWEGKGTPLPLDCPNKLVIKGAYKFVRNPLAIAGIGQGISVGILLGSFFVILYAIFGAILWHIIVRPIEEKDLEQRFGKSYLKYKQETKCWIPNLK